jgi:hypothetical protein
MKKRASRWCLLTCRACNNNNNNNNDRVCAQRYFNICKEIAVKLDSELWCEHVPKSVETSQVAKVTTLWNQQVQTDRTISNNKPGIIILDNETGTCVLIDIAIPGDRNVIKKEAKKILKYKDLITEIQGMWNVKTKVTGQLESFQNPSENT